LSGFRFQYFQVLTSECEENSKNSQKVQASISGSNSVPAILRERPAVTGLLKRSISRYVDWNLGDRRISGFNPARDYSMINGNPFPVKRKILRRPETQYQLTDKLVASSE
jgi:hypothetical protein